MPALYSPVRMVIPAGEAPSLYNHIGWPAALPASLACLSTEPLRELYFAPRLLDAHALSGESPDVWDISCPAAFFVDDLPWVLDAVLPVQGSTRITPVSNSARDYWQRSASAWLTDWLAARKLTGTARVGWPVSPHSALFQLFKQKLLEVLRLEATPPRVQWEPDYLVLSWPHRVEGVMTYGAHRHKAYAAAQQCMARLSRERSAVSL